MKNEFIKIRVSRIEKKVIEKKALKAGLSISEFIRRLAFEKELKSKLTDEEIECYKSLSKYAENFRRISNLFKLGDITGIKEDAIETGKLIREHLRKFQ
ncbi:mobilization protein [Chryseobacterium sp. LC2016-29]|uniref:plasmid mobilization protein n=1 Tax=Chryseobacterium sp. LC2016-29 TaxID=2897331 RepID=UPI001E36D44E|nr:mobilization protein [Chryseobacterium sp. LC2016-29]MCD0477456.1 mobilization protein [Chryseobacterium sp. LC2016-29]